jgi:hypothetical protein
MYADDMYNEFGRYDFDKAEQREAQFVAQYGQQALDEIENISQNKWQGTKELQELQKSRKVLEPYWQLSDHVWDDKPDIKFLWDNDPQLSNAFFQWQTLVGQDSKKAKRFLLEQPHAATLVEYGKRLAIMKKRFKLQNPDVAEALKIFY